MSPFFACISTQKQSGENAQKKQKKSLERFLSKSTTKNRARTREYVYVYTLNGEGKIIHHKFIGEYTPNVKINKRVPTNTGLSASKQSNGDKHQIAQAGGNITQINYYGSDYSMAKQEHSQQMDPEKFTKPITDLANGPALKSPTVEEAGYSDRIMQITAGNSTITTQEAVNAVVAYGVWPDYDLGVGEAIDKLTQPGPAVDRFYTLDSFDWTKADSTVHYWGLPGAINDLGVFGQNVAFHFLMRSGFAVHVQCNASKFHQGVLMVVAIPEMEITKWRTTQPTNHDFSIGEFSVADMQDKYPVAQLTIFPHQLINLRTNNSATLILPYVNSTPAENGLIHNYWTLCIIPIVPLDYAAGSSTNIPITLSIAPMHAEFSGLRNAVALSQGVPTFQVPGSQQFVTTLQNSGYPLYSEFQATQSHRMPGRVTNLLEICKIDSFCNLGNGATTGNFLMYLNVTNNANSAEKVGQWDMAMTSELFESTIVGRIAKFYTHYRGSVKLTFLYCGSAMSTGKFLISYTPPGGDAPQDRKSAMLGTHLIWDIGLQSSTSFVIPYMSQTQYRFNNNSGNALSYAGYISLFKQTQIVVPVGCPTTVQILVMASVCDDFEFRIPTDSAYFQGIRDEVHNVIQNSLNTALQTLEIPAVDPAAPALPSGLTVQSGDSNALTAPETGASATVAPSSVIETRAVSTICSGAETDVELFMSRYALFHSFKLNARDLFERIPLEFNDKNTQIAIRAKYNMFTYVRCNYDLVFVVSCMSHNSPVTQDQRFNEAPPVATLQFMFCPPGAQRPSAFDSPQWDIPTNPSWYVNVNAPAASVRVPFMSPSSFYSTNFNGFHSFPVNGTFQRGTYAYAPGNTIGEIYCRFISGSQDDTHGLNWNWQIKCFARPVAFEGYIPRPIVTFKEVSRVALSRGRRVFVAEDYNGPTRMISHGMIDQDIPEVETFEVDEEFDQFKAKNGIPQNRGPKKMVGAKVPVTAAPIWAQKFHQKCYVAQMPSGHSFTIMPISKRSFIMPYHLFSTDLVFRSVEGGPSKWSKYNKVFDDLEHDLVVCECEDDVFVSTVQFCLCSCPSKCWFVIKTSEYQYAQRVSSPYQLDELFVGGGEWIGPHMQKDLLQSKLELPFGACGSPLVCEHGICGMATVSDGYWGWFTNLSQVEWLHAMEQGAVEQGPMDWLNNAVEQMGYAFGNGASDAARRQVNAAMAQTNYNPAPALAKEIISLLVKCICGVVLISKSYDKFETAITVGVMLGVDFLSKEPFEWLKEQVCLALNLPYAQEQGIGEDVSNWIKEFNAACTAARGLDWIASKISKFVEWIKTLFEREDPKRKKFMEQIEQLPKMMEQFDQIEVNRGKYDPDLVKKICHNFAVLKKGADLFGVQRNQATTQIVNYYKRSQKMLKGMSEGRVEPVAICIHGSPGTGKSLASELIGRCICQKLCADRPYSLPPDPKYFDGYCQQPVVIMDDVGQNPDGEDLSLFCQMVSSTEFQVPMADLEDKGTQFTSRFVIATTNCDRLAPVTIVEPKALERRFHLDLNIVVQKDYAKRDGKVDASSALTQCSHQSINFKSCCPLVCGKAISLKDKRSGVVYSVDDVVSIMMRESQNRLACGDKLDALFQGLDDDKVVGVRRSEVLSAAEEWLESDFDRMPERLMTIEEQQRQDKPKPMPKEVADLLQALSGIDQADELLAYCRKQNWIVPAKVEIERTRVDVRKIIKNMSLGLSVLASVCTLGSFIYLLYKIFASSQGAYDAGDKKVLKKPELRRQAVVQGPDTEFANKILNSSLFDVKTRKGHYSGLGLFDTWMILPLHSDPMDSVEVDGKEFKILDNVELRNEQGALELVMIKLDRPTKFRDIRRFIPDHFSAEKGCMLVVNNVHFPRLMYPVGTVTMFGFLNLSMQPRYRMCTYRFPTKAGQCGGVITTPGKIIGLHVGGDGLNGYAAILTKGMFAACQGEIVEKKKNPEKKTINLSTKTKLHPSVFHEVFEGEKEPAALHPKDKRLEVDLEEAMFGKYKGNVELPEELPELEVAIEHYAAQIKPLMPEDLTEPLELEEVVYGIEGLEGIDKKTSAGYPYVTMGIRKTDLIPERGESLSRLQEALDLHGFDLPYVTYLKDELRPKKKVAAGKTRLIECSSLNDTIRMKITFGRLFKTFHQNPGTVTGSAVGCNPDLDWSRFYREFNGQPLMAFDYSNFDASLHPIWFDSVKKVLKLLGYSDSQVKIIDHVKNSTHLYKDQIYKVEGGMPSGCSGTSIFNSIINNLIIRTLVLRCYKGIDLDELKIIAYGDDVLCTYPFQLDASIVASEGKTFGLTMTPPDKEACFNETTWDNVTFLKRRFVPDSKYPFLIHPVFPMSEVKESIRWCRSAAATGEHVHSLCLLAWHSGKDEYEEFVSKIRSVPVGRALMIPSYTVLEQYWYDSF